jgi:hypothetical protein
MDNLTLIDAVTSNTAGMMLYEYTCLVDQRVKQLESLRQKSITILAIKLANLEKTKNILQATGELDEFLRLKIQNEIDNLNEAISQLNGLEIVLAGQLEPTINLKVSQALSKLKQD